MIKSALQSSLTNDVKYSSMSAGAVPSSEYLIESFIVGSTPLAGVDFTNLNQYAGVYQHLQIRFTARSSRSSAASNLTYRINGVSTNSYAVHFIVGNGSSVIPAQATSYFGYVTESMPAANTAANIFCSGVIDLLDPFETTKNKVIRASVGSNVGVQLISGLLQNTDVISSFSLRDGLAQLVEGTRVSLYGVTA